MFVERMRRTPAGNSFGGRKAIDAWEALFDEGLVDNHFRLIVDERPRFPTVDLMFQRFKIPLHLIHADAQKICQIQAARVLVQHRRENA